METTKNEFTTKQKQFLNSLSEYLEIKFLYYGSIQREDYIIGKSDIDVLIFTDNDKSTIAKMQHFLHVNKEDFKKIVWKLREHDKIVTGYKLIYENDFIKAEFAVYNNTLRQYIIREHNSKINIPFYIIWLLNLLKTLFYKLQIIPPYAYIHIKRFLFSYGLGYTNEKFFIF
jgi:predicted nucleotidyltransferase